MSKIYSMPITPYLDLHYEWETTMGKGKDPEFSFALPRGPERRIDSGRFKDAFAMRERFFAIEKPEDALEFFREFGPYKLHKLVTTSTALPTKFSTIRWFQDQYLRHLLRPLETDRVHTGNALADVLGQMHCEQNLPMELRFSQPMRAEVRCQDVQEALRATVFLDRLRALPWRSCARVDCGKPFEVTSKRGKIYCSYNCAHLASVRAYNGRPKTEAKKTAKEKGK
jgi:hypothetical protein